MHRLLQGGRRVFVAVFAALAILGGGTTGASAAQPWPVQPGGPLSLLIGDLFWLTFVIAAIVFVLVEGLLIYSSLRFRRRAPVPTQEPPQIHGNTRLEIMWAIVPALILVGLFGMSVRTLNAIGTFPDPQNAMNVHVIGQQFSWTFRYPELQIEETNELHVPVGRPVVFEVTSRDVQHSFWVPNLFGKIDMYPGRVNRIWFQADRPGVYRGVCAELCGVGHAVMLFRAEAMPEQEFLQWAEAKRTGAAAAAAAGPSAEAGREVFVAQGCGACHTLPGVPAAVGQIGPSLAGIGTRAAQRAPGLSAEAYIAQSIAQPNAFVVPGFPPAMPQIPMAEQELAALTQFLLAQR